MNIRSAIKENCYQDSVRLMRLSGELKKIPGVTNASVMMATEANKRVLQMVGLFTDEMAAAGANDLLIVVEAETGETADSALQQAEGILGASSREQVGAQQANSLELALEEMPGANMAVISVPGVYAKLEAARALAKGLHVMLFSDNVTIDEEIELKNMAKAKGLLLMGPDCGTSIINGVCLGFANVVNKGSIGIIGASGTGIQEVSSLIHLWGGGCSQVIGVGGRDLKEQVGGIMMLEALQRLEADKNTQVIVIISKPPAPSVMAKVLKTIQQLQKPVVINLLGGKPPELLGSENYYAATLEEAAVKAITLAGGKVPGSESDEGQNRELGAKGREMAAGLASGQRYLRGLFSGGTLCYEAMLVLEKMLGAVHSNVPLNKEYKLAQSLVSFQHTCIDLGEDEFTVGRPHPMIDMQLRSQRILAEAGDPSTAVILLDVVLGYGANPDPAGELAPVIAEAKSRAQAEGRQVHFIAHVCGTDQDPQNMESQVAKLEEQGVVVMSTNARAAALAASLIAEVSAN